MKVCAVCSQNCTDAEEVCSRCGSKQFRYFDNNGKQIQNGGNSRMAGTNGQRPPMGAPQNRGLNGQRPPMRPPMQGQNMGQNQMGQHPQMQGNTRTMQGQSMGQNQMGQRPPMQNQGMGQRPQMQRPQMPNHNMGQNIGQRPQMQQSTNETIQENTSKSVPMTQLNDGDLIPRPDVSNLPPKEAKRVMAEWRKRVAAQAKQNKKLAKQQQDALKKVEQLKKKGKPVPPELEQLAAGAAISAANEAARVNGQIKVRGQQDNAELTDETTDTTYSEDSVTVQEWVIYMLLCMIPIYNIILVIKTALGKRDVKGSMIQFAKTQCIFIGLSIAAGVIFGLIAQIVASSMW